MHKPQVAPLAGNRDLGGDLKKRTKATRQLGGNLKFLTKPAEQSMNHGGRYRTSLKEMVKADSKKALKKAQQKKFGQTESGQRAEPVILNPEKNTITNSIN